MSPHSPAAIAERSRLRLRSLSWALLTALAAAFIALGLAWLMPLLSPLQERALEPALRAAGCGFFYGLLAFHLQRVDPDDGHLQAGLVGAVCGFRSLGAPLPLPPGLVPGLLHASPQASGGLSSLMMEALGAWLPLWLPLIGSAVLLQIAQRLVPTLRP
ncbi:MAG: hypothetical protein VKI83_10685 [Synechococcaceae cyanobacterium]|nr:hypothetical protein [Synechococcaceae cyanobacterium]